MSDDLLAQGYERLQRLPRLLQSLPCFLALPDRLGVVLVLNRVDPPLGIGDRGLLPLNLVVGGVELSSRKRRCQGQRRLHAPRCCSCGRIPRCSPCQWEGRGTEETRVSTW